jgi:hypothetical protein
LVEHRGPVGPGQIEVSEVHVDKMHILGRSGVRELRAQTQCLPLRDFAITLLVGGSAPRKRERAMTDPHFCVGSTDGDTETSAPGA